MIGTVTWRDALRTNGSPWYDRPDVASCGQFAVEPAWQSRGVGSMLLSIAERRTVETGAAELALDTAETADELIRFHSRRGFRFIEYVRWDVVNYRSVVLSKRVGSDRAPVAAPY